MHTIFRVGKVVLVWHIQLILPFISFAERYQILRFSQFTVKVTFNQTVKNNNCWIFLIFFLFTLIFFLDLETREGWIVQRIHLYIWAAAGYELTAIGTRAQSFNLWLISLMIFFHLFPLNKYNRSKSQYMNFQTR